MDGTPSPLSRSGDWRPTPRTILTVWGLYWVSLGAAGQAMWVGRADYTTFHVTLYYLLLGWGLTFLQFLAPRAKSVLGFVESRHRPVMYALALGCVAMFLGHSHADTCGLARIPDYILHPQWAAQLRWQYRGYVPRFSRCRVLPIVTVGSLIGWFIGVRAGLRLEQKLRRPATETDGTAPNDAEAARRRDRWLIPAGVLVAVGAIRLGGGHVVVWPLLVLSLLAIVVLSLVRFPAIGGNELVIARERMLTAAYAGLVFLVPIGLFGRWSLHRDTRPIAAVVTPFPGASDIVEGGSAVTMRPLLKGLLGIGKGSPTMLAQLESNSARSYVMTTDELLPRDVLRFYRDSTHRRGLALVEDDSIALLLRGNGRDVVVGALRRGYGLRVHIFYSLSPERATADDDSTIATR